MVTVHPKGNMNAVFIKIFHNHKCQPHGGSEGKIRGKSIRYIAWKPQITVQSNYLMCIKILHVYLVVCRETWHVSSRYHEDDL